MNRRTLAAALGLSLAGFAAQAAGPLLLTEANPPVPLTWDMTLGPVPVWTDGGAAFTFDVDEVTPFITIARANEMTQSAFQQWTDVPTATFAAGIAGTIESQTGIADVTAETAGQFYEAENGPGVWVLYDTDGSILEEYFGISKYAVLGIAFPEWADDDGHITEATALMNGFLVSADDINGTSTAGVFTHEFGHAINLSHAQVNGPMVYSSYNFEGSQRYPGVPGCVAPVHAWNHWDDVGVNKADPAIIETMYPFIDTFSTAGSQQATIENPDDIAAISNLYPEPGYPGNRGTITGVLRLKDGVTEYSGINVIARNVNDPLLDAVSAMTGDQTQGQLGPDGRFTINNLTPGEDYEVYIDEIFAGRYPTTPQMMASQSEYWNAAESRNPANDRPCNVTSIHAEAGVPKTADIRFNGYTSGVQFTPIVDAYLTDLSKNGAKSAGIYENVAFLWDRETGIEILPPELVANNSSMSRYGEWITVQYDPDHDGIAQAALRKADGSIRILGDLNGDTCGGSSQWGANSSYGWAVDDLGRTAVGTAYLDTDGNGFCEGGSSPGEVVPFVWRAGQGFKALDISNLPPDLPWVRAHAVSGNGEVILGTSNFDKHFAWVNDGPAIDLTKRYGAMNAYAASADGHRVALSLVDRTTYAGRGVGLWDHAGGLTRIGAPTWCKHIPYVGFEGDLCATMTPGQINAQYGRPPVEIFDMSDDGSILIGRSGSFFTGFTGVLWIEDIGWFTFDQFFRKQGVAEASNTQFSNPISISGTGKFVSGGMAGVAFSWIVDMRRVFVCENGQSVSTDFPLGLRVKMSEGAEFGRCPFVDE